MRLPAALAVAAALAACSIVVAPASPATPRHSCWARTTGSTEPGAPSVMPRATHAPPAEIVRRLLARLGDDRFVRRIEIGAPPPITSQHLGYFGRPRPPQDAAWAYIAAPAAAADPGSDDPMTSDWMLANWEVALVEGALRDEFCAAGGRPLVGWSVGGRVGGVSDAAYAFNQHFANPSAAEFRRRLAAAGRRYGFDVVSLRLLRPLQTAPLLVVETGRDRKEFVADVGRIVAELGRARAGGESARGFEAFFFEARDSEGPFVRVHNVHRARVQGSQWSWDACALPYGTIGLFGGPTC
jgi:hypothetical protein